MTIDLTYRERRRLIAALDEAIKHKERYPRRYIAAAKRTIAAWERLRRKLEEKGGE